MDFSRQKKSYRHKRKRINRHRKKQTSQVDSLTDTERQKDRQTVELDKLQ